MARLKGTTLGAFRAYFFGFFICSAGFLFGYDTGIVGKWLYHIFILHSSILILIEGGVLTLKSYKRDFRYHDETSVDAVMVSLQNAGAFLAALFIFPLSDWIGRQRTIAIAMAVFAVGVVLQVAPSHSLICFYIGRIVAGLGLGASTAVAPSYNAEMAPKQIRGMLMSGMQLMFGAGVMISYWIDYAVDVGLPESTKQWQIPVGLQLVPAAILGLGVLTQKESVRWLVRKGREEEAWKNLCWIRADDGETLSITVQQIIHLIHFGVLGPEVHAEFAEIQVGIAEEVRATEGFKKRELLEPANRKRLALAFGIFLGQQCKTLFEADLG